MLRLCFEHMVKWAVDEKIHLSDWHTGNINILNTSPPKFYLIDYDKCYLHVAAGDRARMKGGVETLLNNFTSTGVNEPWRFWVDETKKHMTEWWAEFQPGAASEGDLAKLMKKFTALEIDMKAKEKSKERIINAGLPASGSAASGSAGSASISTGSTELATSAENHISGLKLVISKKRLRARNELPAVSEVRERSESSSEPDWGEPPCERTHWDDWPAAGHDSMMNLRGLESNNEDAGGGDHIEASEDLEEPKPKIRKLRGSVAVDWFQDVVAKQMARMANVDKEACHGKTSHNFRSRRQRMADPSLNAMNENGHDPIQIHRDKGLEHCEINNDLLRLLFEALLNQIGLTGWLEERMPPMKKKILSTWDSNEFHSRQQKHFVKIAPDWKSLNREGKAHALNEFLINKFSTDRKFWDSRKMQPTTTERVICQISWPGFYMTESEKEDLVQKVIQEYLRLERSVYPDYATV